VSTGERTVLLHGGVSMGLPHFACNGSYLAEVVLAVWNCSKIKGTKRTAVPRQHPDPNCSKMVERVFPV